MKVENRNQQAYWSDGVGQRWASMADQFDQLLEPVTQALLAAAGLEPGQRVLDVGCGAGASTFSAAAAVGLAGHVTGLDISSALLGKANDRARKHSVSNVSFRHADAQVAEFSREHYAMISRLGIMFFDNPTSAFTNLSNALHPNAKITFACWSKRAENPWFDYPARIRAQLLGGDGAMPDFTPGPMAFSDIDRVAGVMAQAGWRGIKADRVSVALPLANTLDDSLEFMASISPFRSLVADLSDAPANLSRAKSLLTELIKPHATPTGVSLPGGLIIYSART